jgi:hypothetical protein
MEKLAEAAERMFARHETFHPRYGWFLKAVQAAASDPDAFQAEDSTVELGVGKNMVRSIRFWGKAAKLIVDTPNPSNLRSPHTVPTLNGMALFDVATGLDPYAELPGTLWVLHWWFLRPPCLLPVWWIAFHRFSHIEFGEDDLFNCVEDAIERSGWEKPNPTSVRKDTSCLLRTYSSSGRETADDALDGPMRELNLIEPAWDERGRHRFLLGVKPSLPEEVVAYACLDWMAQFGGSSTVTVNRLATAIGSPGRAFRMSEAELLDVLTNSSLDAISITTPGGAPQLVCDGDPAVESTNALRSYYKRFGHKIGRQTILGDSPVTTYEAFADVLSEVDRDRVFSITDSRERLRTINEVLRASASIA